MVTRKDVAEKVGVSVTAVSRVINNSGYVAQDKREAILRAVNELGYRPKSVTVTRFRPDSKQILFLNKNSCNAFTMEMYRGMVDYAWQFGYIVSVSGTWEVEKIKSLWVSGVILSCEAEAEVYDSTFQGMLPLPTVAASYGGAHLRPRHIPFVECDAYHAMEILLKYLIEKGHKKIAFASPYPVLDDNPRGIAFINIMKPYLNEKLDDYVLVDEESPKLGMWGESNFFQMGEKMAEKILQLNSEVTAVACFNDDIAVGMMLRFLEMGIHVPEDISIIGVGGLGAGRYCYPRLTTVSLSPYQQGWECARILLDMIEDRKVRRISKVQIGDILEGNSVKNV